MYIYIYDFFLLGGDRLVPILPLTTESPPRPPPHSIYITSDLVRKFTNSISGEKQMRTPQRILIIFMLWKIFSLLFPPISLSFLLFFSSVSFLIFCLYNLSSCPKYSRELYYHLFPTEAYSRSIFLPPRPPPAALFVPGVLYSIETRAQAPLSPQDRCRAALS